MIHPIFFSALLLSVTPGLAASNTASARLKGYNYGYIYGVGNILCGLAIDNFIKKEYAKDILSGTVKALSENPDHKPYVSDIRNSYQNITEDIVCKEVYQ
ncbi:hypothetical protein [Synechococcus sp. MIT S9508]|uniref:hypothetical protein n=1 Tax=Synechococcus sp. MIT S9508 TaxID=1801629 RepID=UPI0007BBED9F|nr:hypothetical protein [Synechococcus sp. MIT S9508]KZR87515.1 hypothetical protein MITS9508_02468 [Synechococcus sp. MIT S9508]